MPLTPGAVVEANSGEATPGDQIPSSGQMVWNNSAATWHRQRGAGSAADGAAYNDAAIVGIALFNGGTWDKVRNNQNASLLSLASRTVATSSAAVSQFNFRGIKIRVRVTVAAAAQTLQVSVSENIGSGGSLPSWTFPLLINATGAWDFILYPGAIETAAHANVDVIGCPIAREFIVTVTPSSADPWTYAVNLALML